MFKCNQCEKPCNLECCLKKYMNRMLKISVISYSVNFKTDVHKGSIDSNMIKKNQNPTAKKQEKNLEQDANKPDKESE